MLKFLSAVKNALVNVAEILDAVGFNTQLLGSSKYVLAKLQGLKGSQLDNVKEAFIRNMQPRFMKQFFSGLPYGRHKMFKEKIREANLETLARLIKICGLLLQTKVYLHWKRHHRTARALKAVGWKGKKKLIESGPNHSVAHFSVRKGISQYHCTHKSGEVIT